MIRRLVRGRLAAPAATRSAERRSPSCRGRPPASTIRRRPNHRLVRKQPLKVLVAWSGGIRSIESGADQLARTAPSGEVAPDRLIDASDDRGVEAPRRIGGVRHRSPALAARGGHIPISGRGRVVGETRRPQATPPVGRRPSRSRRQRSSTALCRQAPGATGRSRARLSMPSVTAALAGNGGGSVTMLEAMSVVFTGLSAAPSSADRVRCGRRPDSATTLSATTPVVAPAKRWST